MAADTPSGTGRSFRVVPALAMLVGVAVAALGLLLASDSGLGGGWIAAIGASLILSGLVSTRWAANRFTLSPADQRQRSLAFTVLAGVLLALFVVVNA